MISGVCFLFCFRNLGYLCLFSCTIHPYKTACSICTNSLCMYVFLSETFAFCSNSCVQYTLLSIFSIQKTHNGGYIVIYLFIPKTLAFDTDIRANTILKPIIFTPMHKTHYFGNVSLFFFEGEHERDHCSNIHSRVTHSRSLPVLGR